MPEIRFNWGQVKELAAAMGLADSDPAPDGAMIVAFLTAMRTVEDEADHIRLFGLGEDD